ncbi:1-phosphofructokinase [Spiroplasma clarkii]|uniref:1-phosphofructokinase family hexose kinase n=1 Tax=Spiroplasma clarkii TaxID=2139 RepID=UPI000B564B65|nr:1-phosphofructokinase family hexose kinase [Spiroplasma clarkii]ARU91647.1 1-phosphofructokinase [Spiroplasma clarkii]
MIYTITLNPAIDHIVLTTKKVQLGVTNYYNDEYKVVGGKGINAAVILNNLGAQVQAVGIMGENNKKIFTDKFQEIKLSTNFIYNPGSTRVNYKIKHLASHQETELNGMGFTAEPEIVQEFLKTLAAKLIPGDIVVTTGSVAVGIDSTIYEAIGKIVNEQQATLICDATNDLLKNALKAHPFLIKPNLEEICSTLGVEFKPNFDFAEIKKLIQNLKELGAQNILLSMGSEGSIFFGQDNTNFKVGVAQGELVNSVGAGDSMLAGFVYGIDQKFSIKNHCSMQPPVGLLLHSLNG